MYTFTVFVMAILSNIGRFVQKKKVGIITEYFLTLNVYAYMLQIFCWFCIMLVATSVVGYIIKVFFPLKNYLCSFMAEMNFDTKNLWIHVQLTDFKTSSVL